MKVVLFCGGLGTRLREYTDTVPKSMVPICGKPMLWHLMRYYAHFGHNQFILCLGYKGDVIREYFTQGAEPDFVELTCKGEHVDICCEDGTKLQVNLVETGEKANIAQRLLAVKTYVADSPVFLANYSDGLADLPLDSYIDYVQSQNKTAAFVSVKPTSSFHAVSFTADGVVKHIKPASQAGFWINGGYFVFKQAIFDAIQSGEELVDEPFDRLIEQQQLLAFPHDGFWACMDTPKDKFAFDERCQTQDMPWQVWFKA